MFRFGSPKIARPVSDGQVFCLVQGQRVDVERCASCEMRDAVAGDDAGSPVEILCYPPLAALLSPDEHRGLLDVDWGP